jgi:cell division septation protein DedD
MDESTRIALAEARSIREQNAQYARAPAAESFAAPVRMASAAPIPAPYASASLPRTRGGVVAMEPIPDGSTPEGAAAMAASAARQAGEGGELLPDGRIIVARMDPIPDGSTPEGAARMAESVARAEPPRPEPVSRAVAAPRPEPAPGRMVLVPPPPPSRGFSLVSSAQASSLPANFRSAMATGGAWAVQVGAFNSPEMARSAAQSAQGSVGGRVAVTSVQVGRSTLFRARVTGLTQPSAQQACDRLRARGGCTVLSPAAQS